uniref:Uncharacterized protein n=1 Tax=Plectus sambesii TaxID=2011161 RepID=A0A914VCD4_9BILA
MEARRWRPAPGRREAGLAEGLATSSTGDRRALPLAGVSMQTTTTTVMDDLLAYLTTAQTGRMGRNMPAGFGNFDFAAATKPELDERG